MTQKRKRPAKKIEPKTVLGMPFNHQKESLYEACNMNPEKYRTALAKIYVIGKGKVSFSKKVQAIESLMKENPEVKRAFIMYVLLNA